MSTFRDHVRHHRGFPLKIFLIISLITAVLRQPLAAQLTFSSPLGPEGTSITSLAKDSSGNLYAAGSRIFRSTDQGSHWTPIGPEMNWSVIAVTKNGTLYAGTGNGGAVLRSTNSGATWNYISGVYGQSIHSITIDPLGRIYIGANTGLFRSTDGVNFSYLESVFQNITYGVHFDPDGICFASTMSGIFRSSDFGANWTYLSSSLVNNYSLVRTGGGAYLAAMGSGLYRSTDRCVTWTKVNDAVSVYSIAIEDGVNIFAGGFNAMLRSTDGGLTWENRGNGLTDQWQKWLLSPAPGLVLTANRTGVNISTDHGASWQSSNNGFGIIQTREFVVAPNGHYFAGTAGGVYRSTDSGATWISRNTGLLYQSVYMLKVFPDGTLFLSPDNGLYRSTNNGDSWNLVSDYDAAAITRLPTGTLIATLSGMHRSTNNGLTWSQVFNDINFGGANSYVSGPDGIVYGTDGVRIIRSTDDGITWKEWSRWAYRATDLSRNGVGHQFAADDYNGIFRSTDHGLTWKNMMKAPNSSHMQNVAVNRNGWIYASNELGELYESRTIGRTWTLAATFGGERITGLFLDPQDHLYVIMPKKGTYRTTTSTSPDALPSFFAVPIQNFGRRRIKQPADSVIIFFNPGADTLRITALAASTPLFVPARSAFSVPPHGTYSDTVSFTLNSIGPHSGSFVVSHNAAPQPDTIDLRTFGFGKPLVRLSADTIRFPAVEMPAWKDTAVIVYNDGDDTLFIASRNTLPASFKDRTSVSVVLAGSSIFDSLRFQPVINGPASGRLILSTNTERGADTLPMFGAGVGYPKLMLQYRQVLFGSVLIGTKRTIDIYCLNKGYDTLKVSTVISTDSAFVVTAPPFTVAPLTGFFPVNITYSPVSAGMDSGAVILYSNSPGGADTIRVSGHGMTLSSGPQPVVVTEYRLDQNYPNPFNPSTTIPFQVLESGRTTLRLYDLLGRNVRMLFDRDVPKGVYSVSFSAEDLPSGVYLCTMHSGTFTASRKLLLSK